MQYLDQYEFRTGQNEFWRRVEQAVLHCADSLTSESPGTDARRAWAAEAYQNPEAVTRRIKNRVANHWRVLAVGAAIPDVGESNCLQDVVNYCVTTFDIREPA